MRYLIASMILGRLPRLIERISTIAFKFKNMTDEKQSFRQNIDIGIPG